MYVLRSYESGYLPEITDADYRNLPAFKQAKYKRKEYGSSYGADSTPSYSSSPSYDPGPSFGSVLDSFTSSSSGYDNSSSSSSDSFGGYGGGDGGGGGASGEW